MMILGTLLLGFLASTAYSRISLPKKGLQQDKIIYKHVIGTETCTRCCKIPLDSANPSSTILIQTAPSLRRPNKYAFLSIVLPWLYFLCISMQLTTLPKYVNFLINQGDSSVSPLSARVYGNMQGIDALFTFLSVGYIGRLSDRYGRKPFFLLSSAGLALSYAILLYALHTSSQSPLLFYLSACIDGLTSCMLSQAQAFVTDQSEGDIGVSLSRFQGLAVGMAYTIGIPLSTMLVPWGGMQSPLYASIGVCALNCLLIAWLLPSKLEGSASNNTESQQQGGKRGIWQLGPLGTVDILIRNR
ncbi:MFS transporter [archaeon]|nr:MAG: MFS transporter [archaeon]